MGGPIKKDRTFFFLDYQGQRQTIGRTVISTVPTLLQRQGVFTESIGGRVPVIYDPATTVGSVRTQFANSTIPANRMDPVALALLARYPLPTSSGTANNFFQRVGDETQGPGPVQRAARSTVRGQSRSRLRAPHALPRAVPAGDTLARR
ncbi:MAG: hypothetical protein U0Q11_10985 [Vicinamibacterales bacterium]